MNPTLSKAAINLKRRARKKTPALWLMSDETRLRDPGAAVAALPRGSAVVLRHSGAGNRQDLAMRLAVLCRQRGLILMIAGDWRLAARVGAAGLHLGEQAARRGLSPGARLWRRRGRLLLTVAAHSEEGARRARALDASAIMLSPVFVTASHPERRPLKHTRLAAIARNTAVPVIALGGITAANVARLSQSGCAGIAGIGFAIPKI